MRAIDPFEKIIHLPSVHFFQACIIYQLDSGQIVFQEAISTQTAGNPCSLDLGQLKRTISKSFRQQPGTAMCCSSDNCNKQIDPEFRERSQVPFLERFLELERDGDDGDGDATAEGDDPAAEGGAASAESLGGLVLVALVSILF